MVISGILAYKYLLYNIKSTQFNIKPSTNYNLEKYTAQNFNTKNFIVDNIPNDPNWIVKIFNQMQQLKTRPHEKNSASCWEGWGPMKAEYLNNLQDIGYKYMHNYMYQSIDYNITPNANLFDGKIFFLARNFEAITLRTEFVWMRTIPYSEDSQQVFIKKLNLLKQYPTFSPDVVLKDNITFWSKNSCLIENQILNAKSQVLYKIDKLQFKLESLNNQYLIGECDYYKFDFFKAKWEFLIAQHSITLEGINNALTHLSYISG